MRQHIITKKKSWFYSPIIAVILMVFVAWGGVSVVRAFTKQGEALKSRNDYRVQLEELNQKQADLATRIENLSTDRGLEAEVRTRYRVVKPGEQLVIVVDNEESKSGEKGDSWWKKVKAFAGF